MNEKLIEIRQQLEQLNTSIIEFFQLQSEEDIIVLPENLGLTNNVLRVFDYNDGAIFILSSNSEYENDHYERLLSGNLQRLILKKE